MFSYTYEYNMRGYNGTRFDRIFKLFKVLPILIDRVRVLE